MKRFVIVLMMSAAAIVPRVAVADCAEACTVPVDPASESVIQLRDMLTNLQSAASNQQVIAIRKAVQHMIAVDRLDINSLPNDMQIVIRALLNSDDA